MDVYIGLKNVLRRDSMKSNYNLKPGSSAKRLFLTVDDKQSLDKIINEQINRLTILQQTLKQSQISELEEEDIKGVILKTEYFLFKLKVHIKKIMSNKKI